MKKGRPATDSSPSAVSPQWPVEVHGCGYGAAVNFITHN